MRRRQVTPTPEGRTLCDAEVRRSRRTDLLERNGETKTRKRFFLGQREQGIAQKGYLPTFFDVLVPRCGDSLGSAAIQRGLSSLSSIVVCASVQRQDALPSRFNPGPARTPRRGANALPSHLSLSLSLCASPLFLCLCRSPSVSLCLSPSRSRNVTVALSVTVCGDTCTSIFSPHAMDTAIYGGGGVVSIGRAGPLVVERHSPQRPARQPAEALLHFRLLLAGTRSEILA